MFTDICVVVLAIAVPSLACPPGCSRIDDVGAFLLSQQLTVDGVGIAMEDVTMLNQSYKVRRTRIEHIFPLLTIKMTRYVWHPVNPSHNGGPYFFNFTVHNLQIIIPSGGGRPTVIADNIYPWNNMQHELGSQCGYWFQCRFSKDMKAGIVHALLNSGYFGDVCDNPKCSRRFVPGRKTGYYCSFAQN